MVSRGRNENLIFRDENGKIRAGFFAVKREWIV